MRLLALAICIIAGRIEEDQAACPESGERELNIGTHRRGTDCGANCPLCVADAGEPKCIEEIPKIEVSKQL